MCSSVQTPTFSPQLWSHPQENSPVPSCSLLPCARPSTLKHHGTVDGLAGQHGLTLACRQGALHRGPGTQACPASCLHNVPLGVQGVSQPDCLRGIVRLGAGPPGALAGALCSCLLSPALRDVTLAA